MHTAMYADHPDVGCVLHTHSPYATAYAVAHRPIGCWVEALLRTRITSYRTRQETLFYLIPVGPKKMTGIQNYRKFIDEFGQRLRTADPSAAFIPDVRAAVRSEV